MPRAYNLTELKESRRELRKRATPQENILWEKLRNRKLGPKFRRQHSIGRYILDFCCPEKKLIVELDGSVHDNEEAKEYDKVRDKFFRELDFKVLRFKNYEVENNMEKVLETIKYHLTPNPSP